MSRKFYITIFCIFSMFALLAQNDEQGSHRVVGGEEAGEEAYPWMVSLVTDVGVQGCGASLIAPQWVLTAGHCDIDYPGFPQNVQVLINALVTDFANPAPFSELIDIETVIVHENYDIYFGGPDIALIRLSEPAQTLPIALASYADSVLFSHGMPAKVLGWGLTSSGGSNADSLLVGNMNFIGNDVCGNLYAAGQIGNPFIEDPDGLICGGYLPGDDEVVGGALGDSGGPLFFEENGDYKQVGIVSFGEFDVTTADFPGVYTLVPQYRDWIQNTMDQYDNPAALSTVNKEGLNITYYANDKVEISKLNRNNYYAIDVYDLSGKLKTSVSCDDETQVSFSVADFYSGLYVLYIRNHSVGLLTYEKLFIR